MKSHFTINQNTTIIDVRSREEFKGGHVINSINIPLQEIQQNIETIKQYTTPIVLCCASGNRSGIAHQYLSSQGIDCLNGGSWLDVIYEQSQTIT